LQDLSAVPVRGDVFQYLARCREQFDFIFADPPYALPQLESIPDCVMGRGLLRPEGLFVLEHGKTSNFTSHPCFGGTHIWQRAFLLFPGEGRTKVIYG